jgi:flagellar protein FliS
VSAYADAQAAYAAQSVLTAPPERLVVMLYDSALHFLNQAASAYEEGDAALGLAKLRRVDAILGELDASLDMSYGELPERLRSIYVFCRQHLLEASLQRDPAAIRQVTRLLASLHEAWESVVDGSADSRAA